MGSYYYFYDKECPYCGKICDELVYSENNYDKNGEPQGYSTSRCEHCGEHIRIDIDFTFSKLEEEGLDRTYENHIKESRI